MCDQPVDPQVEKIFRKPRSDWNQEEQACLDRWVNEHPDNSAHKSSRQEYIEMADLFFKAARLWDSNDYERVAEWLNKKQRKDHLRSVGGAILAKHNCFCLFSTEDLAGDFLGDLYATGTIRQFDSDQGEKLVPLYGFIVYRLRWLCHKQCDKARKSWRESPAKDGDLDSDRYHDEQLSIDRPGLTGAESIHSQSTEDLVSDKNLEEFFRLKIESLPTSLKKVMSLHYGAEYSDKEIAESLGISLENVRTRLTRARQKLAKYKNILDK